jgi:gas vesicle protein
MGHHDYEDDERREKRGGGFLSGFMFGGLIGAALGLVLAPRSGEETRQMIRDRGVELRDQVSRGVEEVKASADQLQQRGRDFVEENRDRIERTATAVRDTAKETWTQGERRPETTMPGGTTSYGSSNPPY